jgi:hypothetical protein
VVFDAPTEFSWTSEPRPVVLGEPRSVPQVTWWFRVTAHTDGTVVDHAFRVVEPEVAAAELTEFFEQTDRVASIRAGMRKTLENIKAKAESRGEPATAGPEGHRLGGQFVTLRCEDDPCPGRALS